MGKKKIIMPSSAQVEMFHMEPLSKSVQNAADIMNGFGDAISQNPSFFGSFGFGGQSGFPGGGSYQQVEDSTTMFQNLRWYLVSNFRQLLSQCFVEMGLVQTITCVPVDDGLRGGILLKSKQLGEDELKELQNSLDRDDNIGTAGWAAKWNRLYGGAGILILVGDQDPEEPLDLNSIGPDTDLEFRAVDMWELFWDKQNTEGYDPEIQTTEFEFYNYYAEQIHKTRVMRMKGIEAPSFIRPRLRGWGVSVVEALVRSINQYLKATDLGFEVLDEFKIDVYKMKNLINTLASPDGTNAVKKRVQMANWQKNYQHAIVMDSEDDFDHKQLSFQGLAEAMEGIRMQVASDMRMPILKLFGQSVSGGSLSSSSTEEMENYNSMVEAEVRGKLKYHILRICEIKCQKLFGMIPDDLELEFKPLRELTPVDQETVKTQKFARLLQAKDAGELTTQEFRDACNKGNLFDVQLDTTEDGVNIEDLDGAGEEEGKDPKEETDVDDPGSNREDSRKVHVDEEHERQTNDKIENKSLPYLSRWSMFDRSFLRALNSAEFDKASYAADGGPDWIDPRRKEIFSDPMGVDKALWAKAKQASHDALGEEEWQFVVWFYKKSGGKFE